MKQIIFNHKNSYGVKIFTSEITDRYSVYQNPEDSRFYLRMMSNGQWVYPVWATHGFNTINDVERFLNAHNWETATLHIIDNLDASTSQQLSDFEQAMSILGLAQKECQHLGNCDNVYECKYENNGHTFKLRVINVGDVFCPKAWFDNKQVPNLHDTHDLSRLIRQVEQCITKYNSDNQLFSMVFMNEVSDRNLYTIEAGISTRDMLKNLVRVKSSNMWGMAINIKNRGDRYGDVIVQFKGPNGGPDDVYEYFDVPVKLYRRWIGATSKGHFFWQYIRDTFKYRKLTGDKRGKLPNAIN